MIVSKFFLYFLKNLRHPLKALPESAHFVVPITSNNVTEYR